MKNDTLGPRRLVLSTTLAILAALTAPGSAPAQLGQPTTPPAGVSSDEGVARDPGPWRPLAEVPGAWDDLQLLGMTDPAVLDFWAGRGVDLAREAAFRAFRAGLEPGSATTTAQVLAAAAEEARRARRTLRAAALEVGATEGGTLPRPATDDPQPYQQWLDAGLQQMEEVPASLRDRLLKAVVQEISGWVHGHEDGTLVGTPGGGAGVAGLTVRTARRLRVDRYDPISALRGLGRVLAQAYTARRGGLRHALVVVFGSPETNPDARARIQRVLAQLGRPQVRWAGDPQAHESPGPGAATQSDGPEAGGQDGRPGGQPVD